MISVRAAADRGQSEFHWLSSRHSFSFGHYYDPAHLGFGDLRVINEDRVVPGAGFDTHGHKDMEIITYVVDGAIEHRDSLGTEGVLKAGDVQRMTAGTGIMHSEYNHSSRDPLHFLQIWIEPDRRGLPPSYEQKSFSSETAGDWQILASPDGDQGSLSIHQDVRIFGSKSSEGAHLRHRLDPGRKAWIQLVRGQAEINGVDARGGDGLAIEGENEIDVIVREPTELLLFDLR